MKTRVELLGSWFEFDLAKPIDLSIPVGPSDGPLAWYVPRMSIKPVRTEHFTGSVKEGGAVNFRDISFNPHGNCTHTECVGHIDEEVTPVGGLFKKYFFDALLITVTLENPKTTSKWVGEEDLVISRAMLEEAMGKEGNSAEALVIRTLPNPSSKRQQDYTNSNPPYFLPEAMEFILEKGIMHLLTDLSSVDREKDGGLLLSHHKFWEHPHNSNKFRTITEMIYVVDEVEDGRYLLELQTVPFVNDAVPSRPLLYKMAPV